MKMEGNTEVALQIAIKPKFSCCSGKEMKKSKFSGYQRDIEQAFMCSIVQAELTQSMQVRSNSPQSLAVVSV